MVRWRCASALRPSPSRLPPGAGNKAQEAKKGEEKRGEGYPAGIGLELVERHGHVATVARHEDGDGAAILPIEEAHGAWRLRLCPPRLRRFAKDSRLREIVNAPYGRVCHMRVPSPRRHDRCERLRPVDPTHPGSSWPRLGHLRIRRIRRRDVTRDVVRDGDRGADSERGASGRAPPRRPPTAGRGPGSTPSRRWHEVGRPARFAAPPVVGGTKSAASRPRGA